MEIKELISEEEIRILNEKFIGKRINLEDEKGIQYSGIAEYIGYNPLFPSWGFQVTVGRLPITNVKVSSLSLSKQQLKI